MPFLFGFWFRRIWLLKKVSVSVLTNLVSKKSLGYGFGKFGLEKSFGFGPFVLSISDPMAELFLLDFCLTHLVNSSQKLIVFTLQGST